MKCRPSMRHRQSAEILMLWLLSTSPLVLSAPLPHANSWPGSAERPESNSVAGGDHSVELGAMAVAEGRSVYCAGSSACDDTSMVVSSTIARCMWWAKRCIVPLVRYYKSRELSYFPTAVVHGCCMRLPDFFFQICTPYSL